MKITVYNEWDHVPKASEEGKDMAVLVWNGEYRKGDVLEFSGLEADRFYVVRADAAMQESLYTRADFPHDNWWIRGTFTFSDGSAEMVEMEKKAGEPHIFKIVKKGITYVSLDKLIKADDPSPFPALTQIEVYGTESIQKDT